MGLFDFFSKSKKKAPAPSKSYTDTSSLAGVEKASRTKKPSLLSDLAMGFGLKEKDASYKIRTQQNIQRQREEAKKQAERKKQDHQQKSDDKKRAATTTGGGGTAAAPPKPREMTEDEKYAEYMKRKLAERRKAGKVKRKEYEVAVGKKVAARRKKVQLLLM
jgi:hypothetical protein